jgi:GWxTD domain-containing protein
MVRSVVVLTVVVVLALSVAGVGRAAQDEEQKEDEYPEETGAALAYYEGLDERWINGPVEYIVLDYERDLWEELDTPEQRDAFKAWFWMRRNQNPREADNKIQTAFYERVAHSNKRFRGFPKGWKSDRGRVYVIVGRPDGMKRQTAQQLFRTNYNAEFTVWTYYTVGSTISRAFTTNTGEYLVFFIEERIGNPEIFDYQFGAGSWPLELRRVFDYVSEALVFDPALEFDPVASDGDFVRSVSESVMPFEVLAEGWGDVGAGGTAVFPVQVALRDLLFQPDGGNYVSQMEVGALLDPERGGDEFQVGQRWTVSLPQQLLAELGTGTLLSVLAVDAPAGAYSARVGMSQPVAASRGEWRGDIEVTSGGDPVATAAIGRMSVPIDAAGTQQLALVAPRDGRFPPGSTAYLLVWVRGAVPSLGDVAVRLVSADGTSEGLDLESSRWLGGSVGPLVIETRLPDAEMGDYELHVSLGPSIEVAPVAVSITR